MNVKGSDLHPLYSWIKKEYDKYKIIDANIAIDALSFKPEKLITIFDNEVPKILKSIRFKLFSSFSIMKYENKIASNTEKNNLKKKANNVNIF